MACPKCSYANDELFRFCQQCGYVRKSVEEHGIGGSSKKLKVDESKISERLVQLSQQRGSSRYVKQKTALECELANFLSHLTTPKTLASALPEDVIAFLEWKDRKGKTCVHLPECLHLSSQKASTSSCGCPKKLAFGTVDALIGKLRAIFAEHGRGTEWQSILNFGNPAADRSVKRYLADVREEQLKARVVPRQADPILQGDLVILARHIHFKMLQSATLTPSQIYIFARDQAMFKVLFFAGDRAADLLLSKTGDILRFPDDSGFLFNHLWTKTLRSGDANVFALKRGSNLTICPVRALELYFDVCKSLAVKLCPGFLFRSVTKSGNVSPQHLDSEAAQARLSVYTASLGDQLSGDRYTLHGFRSGAAVSLALSGMSLHEIMDHVGWKNSSTALRYIKLKQVVNPAGAAAKLADLNVEIGKTYMSLNNLKGFSQAFCE